jgi:hypothetical protein
MKIDKGIPLTKYAPKGRGPSAEASLMRQMKKGDSILLHKGQGAAHALALRNIGKGKYALRKDEDGFRIWKL